MQAIRNESAPYAFHPLAPAPAPAPAPPPSTPPALVPPSNSSPSPSPAPSSSGTPSFYPNPSPSSPAPASSGTSTGVAGTPSTAITNPATGQVSPAVGTPAGYDLSSGIDTSVQALMPDNFDINSLTSPSLPDATTPGANSYVDSATGQMVGPTDWNVTPEQTVAGQYQQLVQQGSPLMQAAREQAIRANAQGGGRNNLMAQTAGDLAASKVAFQIASQDAATNAAAGKYNADAANAYAQQINQLVGNAHLSEQNFNQGVAMLKDQLNTNLQQLYGQVQAGAASTSVDLKAKLADLSAQTNATLETMDKAFSQDVAKMGIQNTISNEQAWTNFGMQVRTSYLASVSQQQMMLMQTIGDIRSNPNINATQASAAIKDAVDQFNSFITMNNAYYSSMVPQPGTDTSNAYASPQANYTYINTQNWPSP